MLIRSREEARAYRRSLEREKDYSNYYSTYAVNPYDYGVRRSADTD